MGDTLEINGHKMTFVAKDKATLDAGEVRLGEAIESTLINVRDELNANAADIKADGDPSGTGTDVSGTWEVKTVGDDLILNWAASGDTSTTIGTGADSVFKDDAALQAGYTGTPSADTALTSPGAVAADQTIGSVKKETIQFQFTDQWAQGTDFTEDDKLTINGKEYKFVAVLLRQRLMKSS